MAVVEGKENFRSRPLLLSNISAIRYILWSPQKIPLSSKKNLALKFSKKKKKRKNVHHLTQNVILRAKKREFYYRALCSRKGLEGGPFVLMDTFVRRLLYSHTHIYVYIYIEYRYIYIIFTRSTTVRLL